MPMKLAPALPLWVATVASRLGPVWCSFENQEDAIRRRTLKDHAIAFVSKFLSLSTKDMQPSSTTRVLWNGNKLLPIENEQEKFVSTAPDIMVDAGPKSTNDQGRSGRITKTRRQKRVGSRRIKGVKSPKSPKSDKNGSLKVIRKNTKDAKSGNGKEILCFQGFRQDIVDACARYNADCCVGDNACYWDDDYDSRKTTICQGSCLENNACFLIAPGSYISEYSCQGRSSCQSLGRYSLKEQPVYVAPKTCVGSSACISICGRSPNCKVNLENESCIDDYACAYMVLGGEETNFVNIASGACYGNEACYSLGGRGRNLLSIDVEENACRGDKSCARLGEIAFGQTIEVGARSCESFQSCTRLGYYTLNITVEDNSCTGERSCERLGFTSFDDTVKIETGSCTAHQSCLSVGENSLKGVKVAADACTYERACYNVGQLVLSSPISIGESACSTVANQCSSSDDPICLQTVSLPPDATSCRG